MDKTTVLGEAIKYLKSLQERVQMFEEKQSVESAVLGGSPSSSSSSAKLQPEVEAKVCNNEALLKIHCHKQNGVVMKILSHLEKLNVTVVHMNVSSFGNLALQITITLEVDKSSTLMATDIVQALHSALESGA